jgi:tetratricopeptide (TPR) repeat protein
MAPPPEHVNQLAHHAFHGERWDKAVEYCRLAGEKDLARWVYREAVASYEQALDALAHLPEGRHTLEQAIDLRLALRTALYPSGEGRRILAQLREAEALAAALEDPRRQGQVLVFLAHQLKNIGRYDQALALAEALGMRPLQAHCHLGLGTLYATIGHQEQARTELSAAITLYRAMAMTFWLPRAEVALAPRVG